MKRLKIKIGQRFGNRIVIATKIKKSPQRTEQILLLQCKCGIKHWVNGSDARRSLSCRFCRFGYKKVGTRFGFRIVLAIQIRKKYGHLNRFAFVQCDCGHKTWIRSSTLSKNENTRCSRCFHKTCRLSVEIGQRFGSRVIVSAHQRKGQQIVLLRCDCGHEKQTRLSNLGRRNPIGCPSCAAIKTGNLYSHPNLTEAELQAILDLKIYKKQTLAALGGAYAKTAKTTKTSISRILKP